MFLIYFFGTMIYPTQGYLYFKILGCLFICATFVILSLLTRLGLLSLTMISCSLFLFSGEQVALVEFNILELAITLFAGTVLVASYFTIWMEFLGKIPIVKGKYLAQIIGLVTVLPRRLTGAIIWSVFSANHTEIVLEQQYKDNLGFQAAQNVHLNIMLTTLATYRRYYPNNQEACHERLLIALRLMSVLKGQTEFVSKLSFIRTESRADAMKKWKIDPIEIWQFKNNSVSKQILESEDKWNQYCDGINGPKRFREPGSYRKY